MNEADLLSQMQRYAKRNGVTLTQLGIDAVGNPALATRLKQGKTITVATMNKALEYMRRNGAGAAA